MLKLVPIGHEAGITLSQKPQDPLCKTCQDTCWKFSTTVAFMSLSRLNLHTFNTLLSDCLLEIKWLQVQPVWGMLQNLAVRGV
jgi:hypothetical protein